MPGLPTIWEEDGLIYLGPLVTHNQCVASPLIVHKAFPLARACWEVGAPQIRNRATVAGNVITASPANDTITPLLALDAAVTLESAARGQRTLRLGRFLTRLPPGGPAPTTRCWCASPSRHSPHSRTGAFIKLGLRRAQAISVVNVAAVIERDGADGPVTRAAISLGAVAPVVVRATAAEACLVGRPLDEASIAAAAQLAVTAAQPDRRHPCDGRLPCGYGRSAGRRVPCARSPGRGTRGLARRPCAAVGQNRWRWPVADAALAIAAGAGHSTRQRPRRHAAGRHDAARQPARGRLRRRQGGLRRRRMRRVHRFSRRHGSHGLPGTRRARLGQRRRHGRRAGQQPNRCIRSRQAFVQTGGVQCGYCTPGFVMSAAKLLEERPHPTRGRGARSIYGQPVPLHRLPKDSGRRRAGRQEVTSKELRMTADCASISNARLYRTFGIYGFRSMGWTADYQEPGLLKVHHNRLAPHLESGLLHRFHFQPGLCAAAPAFPRQAIVFRGSLGWLGRKVGGIPVDRSKSTNFVDQVAAEFTRHDQFVICQSRRKARAARPPTGKAASIIWPWPPRCPS